MARRYGVWEVSLPGETYKWFPDDTTVAEMFLLESELDGVTFEQWLRRIDERQATACQVLVWFLRRKEGRQEDRHSVDFPIRQLNTLELEPPPDESDPAPGEASGDSATDSESPSSDTESARSSGTDSPEPTSTT